MGNCCAKKPMPDIQADVKVEGNKCLNIKKLFFNCKGSSCCGDCDENSISCCSTTIIQTPPPPKRQLSKSQTAHI